ncbi:MAG: 3-oxoacyl-ACP reductase FabG [Ruminiclostridium sp.]|nr:3-oxoacyl-ACP reductase FabG [Ruminiclostridium sp.]
MAVVITGGTGAIGSAIARIFAKKYDVAIIYKNADEKAEALQKELGCKCYKADITSKDQVKDVANRIIADFGKIDVIINNAGISQIKMFCDITELDWYNMIDVHLTGAFNVTQSLLPFLVNRKKGSIINISSVWGVHGASCEVHYSTVKAGLIGFTKALAKELAPCGITVNCITPGVIDSPMNNAHLSKEDMESLIEQTPIGRLGTPEDVARAALYLSEADFVTGQVLGVDGGFY